MQQANLQGVLPRLAEQAIRNLSDKVSRMELRVDSLLKQSLVTRPQADRLYGSTVIEKALQADGTDPLNVTGLLGVLAAPQQASAPKVTTLPGFNDPKSQDGALISYNGILYRFDQSPSPGAWAPQYSEANTVTEVPAGTLNGINTTFTLTYTPFNNTLLLILDGLVQIPTTNYTLSGPTITFVVAPKARDSSYLLAIYPR